METRFFESPGPLETQIELKYGAEQSCYKLRNNFFSIFGPKKIEKKSELFFQNQKFFNPASETTPNRFQTLSMIPGSMKEFLI